MRKFSDITLKRGIVKGGNEFFNWINTKQIATIERRDVIIQLLYELHTLIVRWKANNAFPLKYEGPMLESMSSDVAIETLVLTHEGITVEAV